MAKRAKVKLFFDGILFEASAPVIASVQIMLQTGSQFCLSLLELLLIKFDRKESHHIHFFLDGNGASDCGLFFGFPASIFRRTCFCCSTANVDVTIIASTAKHTSVFNFAISLPFILSLSSSQLRNQHFRLD